MLEGTKKIYLEGKHSYKKNYQLEFIYFVWNCGANFKLNCNYLSTLRTMLFLYNEKPSS